MSHCRTYGSKYAPRSNPAGRLDSRTVVMIPSRPKTVHNNDSLWTKGLEHAQDNLRSPVEREYILYRHIRRRAIHRAFKELLLRRIEVIQEERDRRLHKQRDQIDP